ncbi:DNA cytosine methyltransferase [Schaalia odontolytica]|uniref:Cytosine-specific methyltransferase n=1 Tax=Schaalia odontolytica TaxID=1660 RepID=A0A2X0U4W5_9ACTO|nr:DNA cytosine methyltransferase [Schaalia odontolytica]WMS26534.1 DNA cytosine methyltransferase [Schaalia odontolytica]SPT55315.1 Modification methylase HaeIII [Schaalia odontolytica]
MTKSQRLSIHQATTKADASGAPRGVMGDYSDIEPVTTPQGTFVSLYAGAGGLDIGFMIAGYVPVWVSELDPTAMQTHELAFDQLSETHQHLANTSHSVHVGDILALAEDNLPTSGMADLVIGGPPCQGFSVAGKMDPNDERSKHVFHFLDIVKRVNPRAFVLENVKALYQNKRWETTRTALQARAEKLGYSTLLTLANAADFGVPQARERMFLIGIRRDCGTPEALTPTTHSKRFSVRDAFEQLPEYNTPGNDSLCYAQITTAKAPVLRRSPYAGMLFNGAGRPLNLEAPSMTLPASMGGNKTPIIDQQALENPAKEPWVERYHRKLWTRGTEAVTAEVPPFLRRLTVEEAAAIQTFPIGMRWCGPRTTQFRQIGNAVPPRLALAVARSIRNALEGHCS